MMPAKPTSSVEEARHQYFTNKIIKLNQQIEKRKPPPRPPPPDFSKVKSISVWNFNQVEKECLIEWSPPNSPKSTSRTIGGSISSSFSSSTSSLSSSKKSFEFDTNPAYSAVVQKSTDTCIKRENTFSNQVQSLMLMPTIIRPQNMTKKCTKPVILSLDSSPLPSGSYSPPMPKIPPPSPPKNMEESVLPVGIAIYNFLGTQIGDLPLQVNDVVILLRRINSEWLYGKIDDKEGMFPASFIDMKVPLPETDDRTVTALYEFHPQMSGDLALLPGQTVQVIHKISNDWLFGESNGEKGQFPVNFVDRMPSML